VFAQHKHRITGIEVHVNCNGAFIAKCFCPGGGSFADGTHRFCGHRVLNKPWKVIAFCDGFHMAGKPSLLQAVFVAFTSFALLNPRKRLPTLLRASEQVTSVL